MKLIISLLVLTLFSVLPPGAHLFLSVTPLLTLHVLNCCLKIMNTSSSAHCGNKHIHVAYIFILPIASHYNPQSYFNIEESCCIKCETLLLKQSFPTFVLVVLAFNI